MGKIRGFEPVIDEKRVNKSETGNERYSRFAEGVGFLPRLVLPSRSDPRSAGYDLHIVEGVSVLPMQKVLLWTDVKAYMPDDEVLLVFIRSWMGIKHGLMIPNNVGVIDASYYSNPDNDGNIAIPLVNTTGKTVVLEPFARVAQGIFVEYGVTDDDAASGERIGGIGSSGV